ncbi:hypothetical protein SIN8267_02332 [Sinobacterium norvegicum]|uniref:Uncharacterized protein n=1 Tax=Sinobacterium norvegicum TaxID=1641715 RepID=A0ABM9AG76_9GAMM|nr:hypothetical protein [Sinobacterium norvegicum]CAH0992216.1 hypothetical protein SIN8267_02332 [Sinobacterium norvegicum]
MKLDKAFAEDIELSITAQEADKQFAEGKIKSKFSFQCPDDKCDAPVTCANLDRPKLKRKRDPYYKVVGEHTSQCDIAKDIDPQKKSSRITTDIYSDSDEYVDHAIRLNLQPPSTKRPEPTGNTSGVYDTEARARAGHSPESGKRKIQRSKTLSSLIDAFLANETHTVQLPEVGVIDIRDLFVEINGQDLTELEDEFRIYYGKGWIKKRKGGYGFVFANKLKFGELESQPSTYMSDSQIEDGSFKRFKQSTLDKLANNYPKKIFLLSETTPYPNGDFINIWCEGPEYLDYRL